MATLLKCENDVTAITKILKSDGFNKEEIGFALNSKHPALLIWNTISNMKNSRLHR